MRPNPLHESWDHDTPARPSLAQVAGAALVGFGLVGLIWVLGFLWVRFAT